MRFQLRQRALKELKFRLSRRFSFVLRAALFPFLCVLTVCLIPVGAVRAETVTVVEARGVSFRPGQRVDAESIVSVPAGGKLVAIRPDGRVISKRGPFNGALDTSGARKINAKVALAALVATRNDRSSTIGAVRSGSNAKPLPDPWLIDVGRPGERCLREGTGPVWWRAESTLASSFEIYPSDRSWSASFDWDDGVSVLPSPEFTKIETVKSFIVSTDGQEHVVRIHLIPDAVSDPLILVSWMIEKGCIQQADRLLVELGAEI